MTDHDEFPRCVYCGEPIDYCQGHPEFVRVIIQAHFDGIHAGCNPAGCEVAAREQDKRRAN